jgi:hypothetical protein
VSANAIKLPEPDAKSSRKPGSASQSAGMRYYTADMTIEEVGQKIDGANARLEQMKPELQAARRKVSKATKRKNDINIKLREYRRELDRLKQSGDTESFASLEAKRDTLYKTELVSAKTQKSDAYKTFHHLDQEERQLKAVLYAGNKILQSSGGFSQSKEKTERVTINTDMPGKIDGENVQLDLGALLQPNPQTKKNKRVGIGGSDRGHVFMNASVSMGGRRSIEKVKEFAIACQNRFSVLEQVTDDDTTNIEGISV